MHKVDPMEVMLSDIFDKVFYNKEQEPRTKVCGECIGEDESPRYKECDNCDGEGKIDIEVFMPHNFNRDVGYIDHQRVECGECYGTGYVEVEDE